MSIPLTLSDPESLNTETNFLRSPHVCSYHLINSYQIWHSNPGGERCINRRCMIKKLPAALYSIYTCGYHHHHHHHHQQASAVQQVFDILSLCLHPSLSSAAHFSATKTPSFAKSSSIWILLLPLVGLPFILPSIISCKSPSCLKTWPIHQCFLCQIEFSICLSSFTFLRTSSLVTLSSQLIFSILLHPHFKGFWSFLSVCVNVHVSAA